MKLNRSLGVTHKIREFSVGTVLQSLEAAFPTELVQDAAQDYVGRDRVYTPLNTLLTMVLTATQQDKSLQNSVELFSSIHERHRALKLEELTEKLELEKQQYEAAPRKSGRPRKFEAVLPKSLGEAASTNTAAFSKARDRLPMALVDKLFEGSIIADAQNAYTHWHGRRVYLGDGSYLQLQDTESIRSRFEGQKEVSWYPQGLLEVVIERGTGQIVCFELAGRSVSELPLFYKLIDSLPPQSIVLLDDLYNCYEIIAKCIRCNIDLVVPAKRDRNYEVIETISKGDEIIRIKVPASRSKWPEQNESAKELIIRRIQCKSPEGQEYTLHTTVLDKHIDKEEIQLLYLTRWDIEIGIREVKTIMDINILRSKTPDMALKELGVSLATYNLIRRIIYASIKDLPFSPKEDFIQKLYQGDQALLVDKKGRVYSRWSPGRRGTSRSA
jgi:IS4 transposase